MERFAARKLVMMPYQDKLSGLTYVRVFFKPDNGKTFHLKDYPRCFSKEQIIEDAKGLYFKLRSNKVYGDSVTGEANEGND